MFSSRGAMCNRQHSQACLNTSLSIRQEIQRFESVHPSIYALYDLVELVPDPLLAQQIRDHVVAIEVLESGSSTATPERAPSSPDITEHPSPEKMLLHPEMSDQMQIIEETTPPVIEQETIDSGILTAMGTIEVEPVSGPPVHIEIAQRWTPILTKGLKKEEKSILTKQYMPFMNIPELKPPKLNPELSAAITEPVRKRDHIIENRQTQLATALTAIGCGLQCFLTKGNKVDGIKNINDAARIMCDIFHWETGSRRLLIQSVINKDMKESLQGDADTFLFGKGLSENIKATKAVQKSAKDLSKTVTTKPNKNNNINKPLNWRAPPQQGYKQVSYRPNNINSKQQSGGGKGKTKTEYKKGPQQQHNRQRSYKK